MSGKQHKKGAVWMRQSPKCCKNDTGRGNAGPIEPTSLAADACRMAKKRKLPKPTSWGQEGRVTRRTVEAPDKAAAEFKVDAWRPYVMAQVLSLLYPTLGGRLPLQKSGLIGDSPLSDSV
jgi:hypothetical protein